MDSGIQRRPGIGRGRGAIARSPVPAAPVPETRQMQRQSIDAITQGMQATTIGGRYRPSGRAPMPVTRSRGPREEHSSDSGQFSGGSDGPPSPGHGSLAQRVKAQELTREQKRLEEDTFDQSKFLQPSMKLKIQEGQFYGSSGTEVILSSNFYRVRNNHSYCSPINHQI